MLDFLRNNKKLLIILGSILLGVGLFVGLIVGLVSIRGMDPLPQWVTDTFSGIQAALVGIGALACIVLIIGVLASPPQTGVGKNVITGAQESYYTKNKGKNNQGRVQMLIIICASVAAVSAILYFILFGIYQGV